MMNAVPRIAPPTAASVISQKSAPSAASGSPSRNRTGTVKMMPELETLTADAQVCAMLVSRMEPRRSTPRRTPKPSTAAMALPVMVKPIFSPAYVIAAFMTTPITIANRIALAVASR